jgi:hypothetical protein
MKWLGLGTRCTVVVQRTVHSKTWISGFRFQSIIRNAKYTEVCVYDGGNELGTSWEQVGNELGTFSFELRQLIPDS